MALAALCRSTNKSETRAYSDRPEKPTPFVGFIVDHKLREGSTAEAHQVANELVALGIEPQILELDWSNLGDPAVLANVESIARRLRYQALGKACYRNGIGSLLFGHHADDQAETVLSRIFADYMGHGLAGIRSFASIPECAGIYGVDHSGGETPELREKSGGEGKTRASEEISIERGGVVVERPLLAFRKNELRDFCSVNKVRWFEDQTNNDAQLTVRNTVRSLHRSEALPKALQFSRLSEVAARVDQTRDQVTKKAQKLYDAVGWRWNIRTGTAIITIPQNSIDSGPNTYSVYAHTLRRILAVVAPRDVIDLQTLDTAIDYTSFSPNTQTQQPETPNLPTNVQIAGVQIQRLPSLNTSTDNLAEQRHTFRISRATPFATERSRCEVVLWSTETSSRSPQWQLWDGRYWLHITPPRQLDTAISSVSVRFLDQASLARLRESLPEHEGRRLEKGLRNAKGQLRFTLPAVVVKRRLRLGGSSEEAEAEAEAEADVVALPSLLWARKGWRRRSQIGGEDSERSWLWDIRYKFVDVANKWIGN